MHLFLKGDFPDTELYVIPDEHTAQSGEDGRDSIAGYHRLPPEFHRQIRGTFYEFLPEYSLHDACEGIRFFHE